MSAVHQQSLPRERGHQNDPNGNRLCTYQSPATDCAEAAVYDSQDRLRHYAGTDYAYTDRGTLYQRMTAGSVETFTYDALGNLTSVERDGQPAIHYVIDAQGRRVGKQVAGSLEKQYVWSSALKIAAELDGTGAVVQRFIYGRRINVPAVVARLEGGAEKLYRVITDQMGSPVYVVNIADASDVLLDATYDEWGNVTEYTSSTGSWPIPFGFAGGLYDEDTKLVRFGARDYDPAIGRWTAKDPILFDGNQANLYVYSFNSPTHFQDPEGEEARPFNECMDDMGVGEAIRLISVGAPAAPFVPKTAYQLGRGLGGSARFTNLISRAILALPNSVKTLVGVRVLARIRRLAANPVVSRASAAAVVGGVSYTATSTLLCAAESTWDE